MDAPVLEGGNVRRVDSAGTGSSGGGVVGGGAGDESTRSLVSRATDRIIQTHNRLEADLAGYTQVCSAFFRRKNKSGNNAANYDGAGKRRKKAKKEDGNANGSDEDDEDGSNGTGVTSSTSSSWVSPTPSSEDDGTNTNLSGFTGVCDSEAYRQNNEGFEEEGGRTGRSSSRRSRRSRKSGPLGSPSTRRGSRYTEDSEALERYQEERLQRILNGTATSSNDDALTPNSGDEGRGGWGGGRPEAEVSLYDRDQRAMNRRSVQRDSYARRRGLSHGPSLPNTMQVSKQEAAVLRSLRDTLLATLNHEEKVASLVANQHAPTHQKQHPNSHNPHPNTTTATSGGGDVPLTTVSIGADDNVHEYVPPNASSDGGDGSSGLSVPADLQHILLASPRTLLGGDNAAPPAASSDAVNITTTDATITDTPPPSFQAGGSGSVASPTKGRDGESFPASSGIVSHSTHLFDNLDNLRLVRLVKCKKSTQAAVPAARKFSELIDRLGLNLITYDDVDTVLRTRCMSVLDPLTCLKDGSSILYVDGKLLMETIEGNALQHQQQQQQQFVDPTISPPSEAGQLPPPPKGGRRWLPSTNATKASTLNTTPTKPELKHRDRVFTDVIRAVLFLLETRPIEITAAADEGGGGLSLSGAEDGSGSHSHSTTHPSKTTTTTSQQQHQPPAAASASSPATAPSPNAVPAPARPSPDRTTVIIDCSGLSEKTSRMGELLSAMKGLLTGAYPLRLSEVLLLSSHAAHRERYCPSFTQQQPLTPVVKSFVSKMGFRLTLPALKLLYLPSRKLMGRVHVVDDLAGVVDALRLNNALRAVGMTPFL